MPGECDRPSDGTIKEGTIKEKWKTEKREREKTMKSRVEEAVQTFEAGFGCAQAVFATYADLFGMERETALKLASPLGGGVGRMREICGTVSGMALLTGLKEGNTDPKDNAGKERIYTLVREMSDLFREENGAIVCKELLGKRIREQSARPEERTPEYYAGRPCSRLVASAAKIVEEVLLEDMD